MSSLHVGCWALFGVLVSVQLVATLRNENCWPIPAQNMFSHLVPSAARRLMVVLHDSNGGESAEFPYRVLPVEFFRAQRILHRVFVEAEDVARQVEFGGALLQRLNTKPWRSFDEMDASVRPSTGTQFVGFDLIVVEFAIDSEMDRGRPASLERRLGTLFSMRIEPAPRGTA